MNLAPVAGAVFLVLAGAAQADSLGDALRRCLDRNGPAQSRIDACTLIAHAQGLEPVAFAEANLGAAYASAGDDAKALAALDKALQLEPALWEAAYDRAKIHMRRLELEAAAADVTRLEDMRKSRAEVDADKLAEIGARYGAHYKPRNAHDDAEKRDGDLKALKLELATAFGSRCAMKASRNAAESALPDCATALSYNPGDRQLLAARAYAEYLLRDYKLAFADVDTAIGGRPAPPNILYLRGVIEKRLGNGTGSEADFRAAAALDPNTAERAAQLGIVP